MSSKWCCVLAVVCLLVILLSLDADTQQTKACAYRLMSKYKPAMLSLALMVKSLVLQALKVKSLVLGLEGQVP